MICHTIREIYIYKKKILSSKLVARRPNRNYRKLVRG